MNAPTVPIGCAVCGITRHLHDAPDHRYQVPDLPTMRARAQALKQATRRCVTCDLTEDRWNPFDVLYIEGGSQCPDCWRHDLNEEATRKHTEAAA